MKDTLYNCFIAAGVFGMILALGYAMWLFAVPHA